VSARISIAVLALGLALAGPAMASDVGYIYGRVELQTGETYEGELRWGSEEAFWDDIFNADKVENENLAYFDHSQLERIRARHSSGLNFLGLFDPNLNHMFAARFGDLKRIEVKGGSDLIAEFRNGRTLRLHGGSNDVGALITVVDPKLGRREVKWNRIRTIEFEDTPAKLADKLGEPIYGTVKTGRYEFTGRIQWDNDETLSTDELDGETPSGKESIEFGDIAAIRRYRSGALVTMRSGGDRYLRGTNDVNSDNRGIVVIVDGVGSVKIGWQDFDGVTFSPAPESGRAYAEYAKASNLSGTVVAKGGTRIDGRIVFDLDEAWDFELLQGMNHDTEYLIPFRDIARITRQGLWRSVVELHNGLSIELEGGQDVSRKNEGLLVFAADREPTYFDWRDVTEITFR
jgi:hypothetical protein